MGTFGYKDEYEKSLLRNSHGSISGKKKRHVSLALKNLNVGLFVILEFS